MQLSQLYVSARARARSAEGAESLSLPQDFRSFTEPGARGGHFRSLIKPHGWCESAFAALMHFRNLSPET
eukprot:5305619-Prymnesium_polylepis.1